MFILNESGVMVKGWSNRSSGIRFRPHGYLPKLSLPIGPLTTKRSDDVALVVGQVSQPVNVGEE
jgi:hypothetical protein